MNPTEAAALPTSPTDSRLLASSGLIFLAAVAGDFLFWGCEPGVSVGIYFIFLGVALFGIGHRTLTGGTALALLAASAVQSGIELCLTNVVVLVTLLLVVFGETSFRSVSGAWARWAEALFAAMAGPLQWNAVVRQVGSAVSVNARLQQATGPGLGRLIVAIAPAAVVAVLFAILLSAGNAVLARSFARAAEIFGQWLGEMSFVRTFFWLVWATVGVAFFWPATPARSARWWSKPIPQWERREPAIALWQSILLLVAVNVVFFAANTADAIYLWSHSRLPNGVSYSAFVHQGVYSLITAVILAGGLLALLFQQQATIARSHAVRGLALAWVLQNLVLLAGVLRRLQLYVASYQFSELRVYVGCFLLLVAFGFVLLAWHIHHGMKLGELIGANVLATLTLFFILQFCDVGTWVANRNVTQWKGNAQRPLDVEYLRSLGPRGWPALADVAQYDRRPDYQSYAAAVLRNALEEQVAAQTQRDGRSYQHRRDTRLTWLRRSYP